MKGIILAGGYGNRLMPCTKVTNKHLLPVYNKPMIYYPLETIRDAGIDEILVVTGPENAGDFMKLLGSGAEFGVSLIYKIQDEAGGIAQALGLAENFLHGESGLFVLGDNLLFADISKDIAEFDDDDSTEARIFFKEVENPSRFGVPTIENGRLIEITEKPTEPKSNLAVIGVYLYKSPVFDIIPTLKQSARGELEITDVNNTFLQRGTLSYRIIDGFWSDAGVFTSLFNASQHVRSREK